MSMRIRRIGERIDGIRDEGASSAAAVKVGAAIEQGAIGGRVRGGDALEVEGLKCPPPVAGTVIRVNVRAAVAAEVPTAAPRVVEHIEVAGGVLANARDAGEALRADLAFDSRRGVEITALNAERTGQCRPAREVVALDVHVGALVPDQELLR